MTLPTQPNRPKSLDKYVGNVRGVPAPGARIPVDTPNHECQRPLSITSLTKWAEAAQEFDWNLFGYPTAVRYPDGSLKLINGQHRITLARWLVPEVTEVPAHIIDAPDSDDPGEADKYAAYLFASMNGTASKKLTPEDMLWAGIIGDLPWAKRTKAVLDECQLACGRVNEGLYEHTVKRIVLEDALQFGEAGTKWAIGLMRKALVGGTTAKPKVIDGQVLKGLSYMQSIKYKGKQVYGSYADMNTPAGYEFYNWFTNLAKMASIKYLQYGTLKTNPDGGVEWHKGCSWGMVKEFTAYLQEIGKKKIAAPQRHAKECWDGTRK